MIYLVSRQEHLFTNTEGWTAYQQLSLEESLDMLKNWEVVQFDTETNGRNAHLNDVLMAQFGNRQRNIQIVVDCTTIDLLNYKEILETKLIIGQNLKFDYQFLFKYGIIPTKTWDTMIVEQLLYLGHSYKPVSPAEYQRYGYDFPYHDNGYYTLSFALDALVEKYVHQRLDKSIRGEIIWRGLDTDTIIYGARDVMYLEDIKEQQEETLRKRKCTTAADIENAFVVVISYLEWCGIKLDVEKWKAKMQKDLNNLEKAKKALDNYIIELAKTHPEFQKYIYVNTQGDLFSGFNTEPQCIINWQSQKQTIPLYKLLGFDTTVQDKETGENKDSAMEKHLVKQKGIDDTFLKLMFGKDEILPDGTMSHYWGYQESAKVCSTYGDVYIDAINPVTGRIHTKFNQLGASSGRMSCGGGQKDFDTDLARYKGLPANRCKFVQIQNLPADHETRGAFVCDEENLLCSCDYAALESRLGADIYNEESMIKEYLEGSGDIHSLTAKACFPKELEGIEVKDIKKKRPDLRSKAKPVEFSQQFGGSARAIQNSLGCTYKEAKEIAEAYNSHFKGISDFKARGSQFVRTYGYIVICKHTGHKLYWPDFKKWKEIEALPEYIRDHTYTPQELKEHNMAASKYDRLSLNSPTQGTGIICLKLAMIMFFKWIVQNNYFNKVLICNLVHDEAVVEAPKDIAEETFKQLKIFMEKSTSVLCKKLPIPAAPEIGDHWIH